MMYAWLSFGAYYVATSVTTVWAVGTILGGPQKIAIAAACFVILQTFRALPFRGGLLGAPAKGVRCLNYYVLLTAYRLNFLYTLVISISVYLAPFVGIVYAAGKYWGVNRAVLTLQLAVLVGWVNYVRDRKDRACAKAYPGTAAKKKVAVIGGGCAGIVACNEMLQEGHDVVGFEIATVLGGVWSSGDHISNRTTGKTLSSSSRSNSFFGDYPFPSSVQVKHHPTHYTEDEFREYLLSYASCFGVNQLYRLGTSVTTVKKTATSATTEGWTVTSVGPDGKEVNETYDFIVVASGLNQTCSGLQLGPEGGSASHTCALRGNHAYSGKKVVVVGLGESSSDATSDIANVASQVHVIVRSPIMLLPRNTFGTKIAPDHKLSRLILQCPQYIRTWKLMSQMSVYGPMNLIASKLLGLRGFGIDLSAKGSQQDGMNAEEDGGEEEDNWSFDWWKLFMTLGPLHPKASFGVTRGQVTKTAPLVRNYRNGNVKFHTAEVCNSESTKPGLRTVILSDGTRIEDVNSIVNATGYKTVWPFLSSEGLSDHCTKDRYRLVFHPKLPNCAFVGFCRGGVGSIMQGIEMQSRWVALVCSGKRRLPPPAEMEELIVKHKSQMVGKFPTKITNIYCNALARYEVGCEPDLWEVFFRSPRAWFYLLCGPFCMSMFRFRGPHACPKLATEVFERGPELVRPLEYGLQQAMELALGVLCRFWTSVFFIHSVRLTKPMRQFVTPFVDLNY